MGRRVSRPVGLAGRAGYDQRTPARFRADVQPALTPSSSGSEADVRRLTGGRRPIEAVVHVTAIEERQAEIEAAVAADLPGQIVERIVAGAAEQRRRTEDADADARCRAVLASQRDRPGLRG